MKNKFLKIYRKLFVIWIAIGISVAGYFYICPVMYQVSPNSYTAKIEEITSGPKFEKGKHFEVAVLITLVGAVLIGGLGYTSNSKD